MMQEKLPFVGPREEWTRKKKRREKAKRYVFLFCSLHVVHGMGGQVKEENAKQSRAFVSLPYLGLWKEAAHASLGYSPMNRNSAAQHD